MMEDDGCWETSIGVIEAGAAFDTICALGLVLKRLNAPIRDAIMGSSTSSGAVSSAIAESSVASAPQAAFTPFLLFSYSSNFPKKALVALLGCRLLCLREFFSF
jgi:hypothetical protein